VKYTICSSSSSLLSSTLVIATAAATATAADDDVMNIQKVNSARCVAVFRGGTTVYIHGSELDRANETRLVVTMIYRTFNSHNSRFSIINETNFYSDVRQHNFNTAQNIVTRGVWGVLTLLTVADPGAALPRGVVTVLKLVRAQTGPD